MKIVTTIFTGITLIISTVFLGFIFSTYLDNRHGASEVFIADSFGTKFFMDDIGVLPGGSMPKFYVNVPERATAFTEFYRQIAKVDYAINGNLVSVGTYNCIGD